MAACLKAMGRIEEAKTHTQLQIDHYREGLKIGGEAYNPQRYAIAVGLMGMAELHAREGDYKAARDDWKAAADIVEPIVEQYQAHADWNGMKHMAALFAGCLEEETEAPPEDVAAIHLALKAWAAADAGDLSLFAMHEQELIDSREKVILPVARIQLQALLALTYGLQHGSIVDANPTDATAAGLVAKKCIEAIKEAKALGADPMMQVAMPEFASLRATDEFKAAFPVQ
jgi:ATP/maltotriose-dependent transcriptional regulator MalT